MISILFININTLTKEKLQILSECLQTYDAIFISEINDRQQLINACAEEFGYKFHINPDSSRIEMIACATLRFEFLSIGLKLDQDRSQKDKTVIQTNVYKLFSKNFQITVENVYAVPDSSSGYLQLLKNHISNQSLKFKKNTSPVVTLMSTGKTLQKDQFWPLQA